MELGKSRGKHHAGQRDKEPKKLMAQRRWVVIQTPGRPHEQPEGRQLKAASQEGTATVHGAKQ